MAFKHHMKLALSEKIVGPGGKKKHKEIGQADIPVPILADFGINAEQAKLTADDEDVKAGKAKAGDPAFDNGVPVYAEPKWDWLQNAITFRIAASSRNKFTKGQLKPGATLAEDFEQLTAETARTGEALALRREAKASFEKYLTSLNKKASTVAQLGELFFNSAKVLPTAGEKYVEALSKYVGEWVQTLNDTEQSRYAPKITELQESINAAQQQEELPEDL